jgi:PAS domain S-box-containing protein
MPRQELNSRVNRALDSGFFCAMLDAMPLAVVVTDHAGSLMYMNSKARKIYDFSEDVGDQFSHHYREIDQDSWRHIEKVLETREPQIGISVKIGSHNLVGSWLPFMDRGALVGMMGLLVDSKVFEKNSLFYTKYKEVNMQLDAIMDASYDGICITDDKAIILKTNSAFGKIVGAGIDEMIGHSAKELMKTGYFGESVSLKVLKEKKRVTISQKYSKTGKEALVTGNPIFNKAGEIMMVVTNIRDMTDLLVLNRRLEESLVMTRTYKKRLMEFENSGLCKNIVMVSPPMRAVDDLVERVSKTNATVLIYGETGVGKEKIAEEIHARSDRAEKGIFVKINCGAIPETLLESELFGYERGAFTGAQQRGKIGLFELADGGTLFLDELGSIPMILQSKLLRVLQNFEITRLGGTLPKKVDVRLICAANQDLKELIEKHQFRSDLYYRLNVIPLVVPPLRERRDDIPHLINLFLDHFNQKYSKNKILSKATFDCLFAYSWPGNVRELENLMERLVVIVPNDSIHLEDLPAEFQSGAEMEAIHPGISLPEYLRKIERSIIQGAIKNHGNARKAAVHLGMDPSTVTRKLKKNNA